MLTRLTTTIPKIWSNEPCWIIGGGASFPKQFGVPDDIISKVLSQHLFPVEYAPYFQPIHNANVIGINSAYLLGDWIDVIWFGDHGFFKEHKAGLRAHSAMKMTCANLTERQMIEIPDMKMIKKDMRNGISEDPGRVKWNTNSGGSAINAAYLLGARKIYLLGFDMKPNDIGETHWHSEYKGQIPERSFVRYRKSFRPLARDAERLGLEIINVNPESELNVFPKKSLKEIL